MHKDKSRLLLLVLAGAALLRGLGLARYSLWYDEAAALYGAEKVDFSFRFLSLTESHEQPFFVLLARFWYPMVSWLPGVEMGSELSDFLLRILPAFFGVLAVLLTYCTGKFLLRDTSAALFGAALVAISPFQIYYSQEFRPHLLYCLTNVGALYFAVRALEKNQTRDWIGLMVVGSVCTYNYYFSVFFLASLHLFFLIRFRAYRKHLRKWVLAWLVIAVATVPAVLMAYVEASFHSAASQFWFPFPTPVTLGITYKNFFAGYSPNPTIYWPLLLIASLLIAMGLYTQRKNPVAFYCLGIMATAPLILNMLFWYTREFAFYTYRAQIPSSIPCFILAGAGIAGLKKKALVTSAALLIGLLTVPVLADMYAQRLHPTWHHRIGARYKVDSRSVAHYINARIRPGDFVGHTSHFTMAPFKHHYLRTNQSVLGFTEEDREGLLASYPDENLWEDMGFLPQRIERSIEGAKRVWYVSSWWEPFDPDPAVERFRNWLDAQGVRIDHARFDGIEVFLYDMDPEMRTRTRRNRIADSGPEVVPHFVFAEEGSPDSDPSLPEVNFSKQFPLELSTRNSAFTVEFETKIVESIQGDANPAGFSELARLSRSRERILGGIARDADGGITARLRLYNPTPRAHVIRGLVYESAHVIPALAFDRGLESNVWRPTETYYKRPAMVAVFTGEEPEHTIRATVYPEAGAHALFLRYFREGAESNQNRAHVTVDVVGENGQRTALGDVPGNDSGQKTGWFWARLADFSSSGEPVVVELTARNSDNLDRAYFDFERVVICRAKNVDGDEPPILSRFRIDLPALSEKLVPIEIDGLLGLPARLDFELFDDESLEMRNVYFNFSQ